MRILLYGEAHVVATGAWCYFEALKELGHEVIAVSDGAGSDKAGLEWYSSLLGRATRKALRGRPLEFHRRRHIATLVETVRRERPELVIVLKGLLVSAEDVLAMRATGAFVTIINHDDFFSLNPNNWSLLQRRALTHYNYVFVTREVNVREVAPLNPNVEFFPFAYCPDIHRRVPIPEHERESWDKDVVFVGTWEAERGRLLEELVRRVPARYAIWGGLWSRAGKRSPLQRYVVGRDAYLDDHAKAIGGAKIALAFLRRLNRDDYTQRTFEIPACGGVLLAERTARHASFYREGVEAEFFDPNGPEELIEKVRALLANPAHREALREAGWRALRAQRHTYRDRLTRLIELHQRASRGGSPEHSSSPTQP